MERAFGGRYQSVADFHEVNVGLADAPTEGVVAQAGVEVHPYAEDAGLLRPAQCVEVFVAAVGGSRPRAGGAEVGDAVVFDGEGEAERVGEHHCGDGVFDFAVEDVGAGQAGVDDFQCVADDDALAHRVAGFGDDGVDAIRWWFCAGVDTAVVVVSVPSSFVVVGEFFVLRQGALDTVVTQKVDA